jgi:hypothetical protein
MTRTYLVAIVSDGLDDVVATAEDIQEELLASGFDVESVKAWAAPTTEPLSTILPPPQPI